MSDSQAVGDLVLRSFQVPTCTDLIKWADKRFSERPQQFSESLQSTRATLESATERLPAPPRDFARNGQTECELKSCRQLSEFLKDPDSETGIIRARKDQLHHVEQTIALRKLDAASTLDRSTRPFTSMLSKTTGSHRRAIEQ